MNIFNNIFAIACKNIIKCYINLHFRIMNSAANNCFSFGSDQFTTSFEWRVVFVSATPFFAKHLLKFSGITFLRSAQIDNCLRFVMKVT